MPIFFSILLPLLALLCLWGSHRTNQRRRLIGNLPTSKTQGIFIGLVELKGTAESEQPLQSFLAEEICVLYSYHVQEEWRREVEEEYTDDQGRTQTRTRIESGWNTISSGGEETPFYLQDDTGVVLVRPEGADIRPKTLFSETCTPAHPLYYGKGPGGAVMDSTFVRRFVETGLPLHHPLFVVGQAREREDLVAPELAHEKATPLYLLTVESEEQVLRRMGCSLHGLNVLGLALAGGAAVLIATVMSPGQRPPNPWWPQALIGAGVYLGLWFATWFILVFNMLVDVRNRMRQGWSSLEVQLKRRFDLIPSLVAAVEGLRSHEADVQTGLAALRAETAAGAGLSSASRHHGLANTIVTLGERYPQLVAHQGFAQLQAQLVDTEQRIALARAYFNDIATAYNTRLEIVPDGWIARLFGHGSQPLLGVEDFERAQVKVDLAR
jgi:hypothetical protein